MNERIWNSLSWCLHLTELAKLVSSLRIKWDFGETRVAPSHYLIHWGSFNSKCGWILEGSNDNEHWSIIDTRNLELKSNDWRDVAYRNESYKSYDKTGIYEIAGRWSKLFFRYLRILFNRDEMRVISIEFWGMIGSSGPIDEKISAMVEKIDAESSSRALYCFGWSNDIPDGTEIVLIPQETRTPPTCVSSPIKRRMFRR